MMIDLLPQANWEKSNQELHSFFQLAENETLRLGGPVGSSVLETTLALANLFSHRRTAAIMRGFSPVVEPVQAYFLREGFEVQILEPTSVHAADQESAQDYEKKLEKWVAELPKELCFFLVCEDHPVTGEVFGALEKLRPLLNAARIPFVRVSHNKCRGQMLEPLLSYEIHVFGTGTEFSLTRLSNRFRSIPALWSSIETCSRAAEAVDKIQKSWKSSFHDAGAVAKFEANLEFGFQPYLKPTAFRVPDRAVVISASHHGQMMVERLTAALAKVGVLATADELDTTNLGRWGGWGLYQSWWAEKDLRGMIVISARLLKDPKFAMLFREVSEQVHEEKLSRQL